MTNIPWKSYQSVDDSERTNLVDTSHAHPATYPRPSLETQTSRRNALWTIATILVIATGTAVILTSPDGTTSQQTHMRSKTSTPISSIATEEAEAYIHDPGPFSQLSPAELNVPEYIRWGANGPGKIYGDWQQSRKSFAETDPKAGLTHPAMPTNSWYLSLLVGSINEGTATAANRAYTLPYIVDFIGGVPGIRVQYPFRLAGGTSVTMDAVTSHGLTLGWAPYQEKTNYKVDDDIFPSNLGLALTWEDDIESAVEGNLNDSDTKTTMKTSVMRGMAYISMQYSAHTRPIVSSELPQMNSNLLDPWGKSSQTTVRIDQVEVEMTCRSLNDEDDNGDILYYDVVPVTSEIILSFMESDFTWMIFVSRPVYAYCRQDSKSHARPPLAPGVIDSSVYPSYELHFIDLETGEKEGILNTRLPTDTIHTDNILDPLIVRTALSNNCTRGSNAHFCHGKGLRDQEPLEEELRLHADAYSTSPSVVYDIVDTSNATFVDEDPHVLLKFDWNARSMYKDTVVNQKAQESKPKFSLASFFSSLFKPRFSRRIAMTTAAPEEPPPTNMLMYALPHQTDRLLQYSFPGKPESSTTTTNLPCTITLHGQACFVQGNSWIMRENLDDTNFLTKRIPDVTSIERIANALQTDIGYELPPEYQAGAGDTYFSGKMLAKLGRIILITQELTMLSEMESADAVQDYYVHENKQDVTEPQAQDLLTALQGVDLPTETEISNAITRLRDALTVWITADAKTPFIYDVSWGGIVSCGCNWNGNATRGFCNNRFPDCPCMQDAGMNFGNGFYNDHHFHYGYFIYSAAVVAKFDPEWGRTYFERVLLLVRDIANPSFADQYFTVFRHKDWFLGSSWASGTATLGGEPFLNGRNQESSSEAINGYEAIGLYGSVMVTAFQLAEDTEQTKIAAEVRDVGRLLCATEIRSADRYWHVLHGDDAEHTIYPSEYQPSAVGMMWNTMVQFQTWFGGDPFLAYGIQLLPITAASERRDGVKWAQQMYPDFANSCEGSDMCTNDGWSVLQFYMLAVVGHRTAALKLANNLPLEVYTTAGGNGHSKTNTLWFISTRPDVEVALVTDTDFVIPEHHIKEYLTDCECPDTCTNAQLAFDASGNSCESRIKYLMNNFAKTQHDACHQVGGTEFPDACGGCDPDRCAEPPKEVIEQKSPEESKEDEFCPPCGNSICLDNKKNQCPPSLAAPYLCLSSGGCSMTAWDSGSCSKCCKLTKQCFQPFEPFPAPIAPTSPPVVAEPVVPAPTQSSPDEAVPVPIKEKKEEAESPADSCPMCTVEECLNTKVNQCPRSLGAPFLCLAGNAYGGCSPTPWRTKEVHSDICKKCCKLSKLCWD